MRENNVLFRQSDRSYLCIVAIYAIHAMLLNLVFIDPELESFGKTVGLPPSYVPVYNDRRGSFGTRRKNTNLSESSIAIEIASEMWKHNPIISSEHENSTGELVDRTKYDVTSHHDYSIKSSNHLFLQSKSGGAGVHFLAAAKISSLSRFSSGAMNTAKSMFGSLSPAAWGIISGCLVFLLTFTENV